MPGPKRQTTASKAKGKQRADPTKPTPPKRRTAEVDPSLLSDANPKRTAASAAPPTNAEFHVPPTLPNAPLELHYNATFAGASHANPSSTEQGLNAVAQPRNSGVNNQFGAQLYAPPYAPPPLYAAANQVNSSPMVSVVPQQSYDAAYAASVDAANRVLYSYSAPHFPPQYHAPYVDVGWNPPAYYNSNPIYLQRHYLPTVQPQPPQPVGQAEPEPQAAIKPHLSSQMESRSSKEESVIRIDFQMEHPRKRYDHSVTELCNMTVSYPLGFRNETVSLGFNDEEIARNPTRRSDLEDAFVDGKCPIAQCETTYQNKTSSTKYLTHILRHHREEVLPALIPTASQREFELDLQAWAVSAKFSPMKFEDPQFRAFILKYTAMDPRQAFSYRNQMEELVIDAYGELKGLVRGAYSKNVFVMMDEWSSSSRESYLGVLIAVIDVKHETHPDGSTRVGRMQVRRRLIGFEKLEGGAAVDLASVARSLLSRAGLTAEDVSGLITDNCATMKLLGSLTHRVRIPCLAHLLQSSIETLWTIKHPSTATKRWKLDHPQFYVIQFAVRHLIIRVRTLFVWIRASSIESKLFADSQSFSKLKPHLDVITRWDSARKMIGCAMGLLVPLESSWKRYCLEHKLPASELFAPGEVVLLNALAIVLHHASRVQESLCEDAPTLPRVLPSMYSLGTELRVASNFNASLLQDPLFAVQQLPAVRVLNAQQNEGPCTSWIIWKSLPESHFLRQQAFVGGDRAPKLLGALSYILLRAIRSYWPFFNPTNLENSLKNVSNMAEPETASQQRGLWRTYVVAALSDPTHLDLKWIDPRLYEKPGRSPARTLQMAEEAKSTIKTIYDDEFQRARGAVQANLRDANGRFPARVQDGYIAHVRHENYPELGEIPYLDRWWLEGGFAKHPVAFHLAAVALLGDATSCEIERVNSQASRINEARRARMKCKSLSDYVLTAYNMRRRVLEKEPYENRRKAERYSKDLASATCEELHYLDDEESGGEEKEA